MMRRTGDAPSPSSNYNFAAKKWFRDTWIPQQDFAWCKDPESVKKNLRIAIGQGLFRREQNQNAYNPNFPTTTLKEGNPLTLVSATSEHRSSRTFRPIKIQGKPLSLTVIEGW